MSGSLLNVPEVAKMLRVSRGTLYNLVRSGRIPAVRVGSMFRFSPTEVEAWLDAHRLPAGKPA